MNPDILKSYLVKLGVQVDTAAFDKMKSLLADVEKAMGKHTATMVKQVTQGVLSTIGVLATVDISIAKTIEKVAEADMKYQLLAQSMFMNVNAAKAFKMATDTLGANLQQIAWNAELKDQYFRLVRDVNDLRVPAEARELFKEVREVSFEFKRAKMLSTSFIERLSFELLKLNTGNLAMFKNFMNGLNESFKANMPAWTKKLAEFLNVPLSLGASLIKVLKALWDVGSKIWEMISSIKSTISGFIPEIVREVGVLLALLALAFMPGTPMMMAVKAFWALLLLIDDAMAFNEGRESLELLKPVWSALTMAAHGFNMILISIMTTWDFLSGKSKTGNWAKDMAENLGEYAEMAEKNAKDRDKKAKAAEDKRLGKKPAPAVSTAPSTTPSTTPSTAPVSPISANKNITGEESGLLQQIAKGEGTSDEAARKKGYASGYDVTLGYGAYGGKTAKPLTEMTMAEIEEHQRKMLADPKNKLKSSALGKYQFTKSTLFASGKDPGLLAKLGISKETKFTPEVQDKLALALIARETKALKSGKMTPEKYQNILAGRWASIARADTGVSAYGQHTGTSSQQIVGHIQNLRKQKFLDSRGNIDGGTPRVPVAGPTPIQITNNITGVKEPEKAAKLAGDSTRKALANAKQNLGIKQMATATS